MSARFIHSPDPIKRAGHRVVNGALFVALAMNPANPDPPGAYGHDPSEVNPTPYSNTVGTSNSVGVLRAVEENQTKSIVPMFLRPESFIERVDEAGLQEVIHAHKAGLPDSKLQELINKRFPNSDFSKHLFTHLRALWAGKAPRNAATVTASPIETGSISDGEMTVALKQIEVVQRWFAVHYHTLIDIVQLSLHFRRFILGFKADGTPIVTPEGKFFHVMWKCEHWNNTKELYAMSEHFKALEGLIGSKSRALKAKLDPQLKKEWLEHMKDRIRKYSIDCSDEKVEELESHVLWSLRAVPWMLTYAPPEFFATHREDFGDLADLLSQSPADLPTSSDGATMGPAVLLKNLSFLGRATRSLCLTAEDSKLFKQHCEAVAAEPYFLPHEESFPPRPQ